jgi:hypothetical protein
MLTSKLGRKPNFVTLTLSSKQIHSDNEITTQCLHYFLTACKRRWKVDLYLWRAEKQANGNLHFHIIFNRFIPWGDMRELWNNCQNRLGYVDRYRRNQKLWHRDGFKYRPELAKKWTRKKQYAAYLQGCRSDWNNPNSTDVHYMRRVGNLRVYLTTYLKKSDQTSGLTCNIWGCSECLENLEGGRAYHYTALEQELERLKHDSKVWYRAGEYFEVFYFAPGYINQDNYPELYEQLYTYMLQKFPELLHPELKQAA